MQGQTVIEDIAKHIKPNGHNKLKVGILLSGNGSNLQALIDFSKTAESSFVINAVITNNKNSLALARAELASIRHYLIDHRAFNSRSLFEEELAACLKHEESELIVLAGFMRVLSATFLKQFSHRVINLHPSLLPKHRGLHAIRQAIDAHDQEAGCTVHLVDEGLDTGPIIAQSSCPINSGEDLFLLTKRIQALEHKLLPWVVNQIAKAVAARKLA